MALLKCPDCGCDVSDKAVACPNCAFTIKKFLSNERRNILIVGREYKFCNNKRFIRITIYSLIALIVIISTVYRLVDVNNNAMQTHKRSALNFLEDMQEDVNNINNKTFFTSLSPNSYLKYQYAEYQSIMAINKKEKKLETINLTITKCYNIYKKIIYSSEPNNSLDDTQVEELALAFNNERQKAEKLIKQLN